MVSPFRFKLLFIVIFFTYVTSLAQENSALCEALIAEVLEALSENCSDLAINQACYAHPSVSLRDNPEISVGENFLLHQEEHFLLGNANPDTNEWGAAALKIQENSETVDNVLNLFAFGSAEIESQINADSLSLQFSTSVATPSCNNAAPVLVLYIPNNQWVELRINGALLSMTGLITMQWTTENSLVATVHTGQMQIMDTALVQAQQTISALTDAGTILFWSAPRNLNDSEIQLASFARGAVARVTGDSSLEIAPEPSNAGQCNNPTHIVADGENLYRISLRYGTTVDAIVAENNLSDRGQISVGQELKIPCGIDSGQASTSAGNETTSTVSNTEACGNSTVHVVEPGENLYRISLRYGTTVEAIVAANNLSDPTMIHAGLALTIPCGNQVAASNPNPAPATNTTSPPPSTPANLDPSAADFCQSIQSSAPPQGLSEDMVNLFNQYCS